MADHLSSGNPFLAKYVYKRKLDHTYFETIDQWFPDKNVCYFCLTYLDSNANIHCETVCKDQLRLRSEHRAMRNEILIRDNYTCQTCGVSEKLLSKALDILKKANRKLWRLKREEIRVPDKRTGILLDVDHVIPISQGGGAGMRGDIRTNLRTLCLLCHYNTHETQDKPVATDLEHSKPKRKNRKIL